MSLHSSNSVCLPFSLCMIIYAHAHVYACVHACGGFFNHCFTLLLRQGLSLNLELSDLAGLTG